MTHFTRDTIQIPSVDEDISLGVWLYKPLGNPPYPLVIAGPGMSVIKDAGLAAFGERWASEASYASLIFDYRFFGDSSGQPRNLVSLDKQLEDYKSVLQWARQHPDLFLNQKIVVMGTSLSGLAVSQLALEDTGIAGAMAQCPLLDGYGTVMSLPFNPRLVFWALVDITKAKLGLQSVFIRAVSFPGEFAMLDTPSSHNGFTSWFNQGKTPFSEAPNLLTPRIAIQLLSARPGLRLKDAHCPILVIPAKEDDITPLKIARDIAAQAPDKVTLVESPGGHFDVMEGGKGFEVNINAQLNFLRRLLK